MKDVITVVIPVYNVKNYLSECIDSVIAQSYNFLQIILVDDGSTDDSSIICDKYALKDSRIEVIHKSNGGLSDARNVAINLARGKYITFIDSDDVIATDMIEYLYNLLVNNNADISICQNRDIDEQGKEILIKKKRIFQPYRILGREQCMHEFLMKRNMSVTAWGKLYRLDLFSAIRYPVGRYHEDLFTTYKLIGLCNCVVVGDALKYYYRQRTGSIMLQNFSPKHLDAIYANEEKMLYISKFYSEELPIAYADIIYAVNRCVYRMGVVGCFNVDYIKRFRELYSIYWLYFLKDKRNSVISKIFVLLSKWNVEVVMKMIFAFKRFV